MENLLISEITVKKPLLLNELSALKRIAKACLVLKKVYTF